jgi:hypothetical protein
MQSINSRFVSSIVVLAMLSVSVAAPAFARGAAGAAGGAGGSGGGSGSGGSGTVTFARVVPPRHPLIDTALDQAQYTGCQLDYAGRLAYSSAGQPCPDTYN